LFSFHRYHKKKLNTIVILKMRKQSQIQPKQKEKKRFPAGFLSLFFLLLVVVGSFLKIDNFKKMRLMIKNIFYL